MCAVNPSTFHFQHSSNRVLRALAYPWPVRVGTWWPCVCHWSLLRVRTFDTARYSYASFYRCSHGNEHPTHQWYFMYVLVTVQAVTWWSNQSLWKQLRYIYSAWYITHPNYLRTRTHPTHLQKDTTIHNLPIFAQLSQSNAIKKQKGRTRDRTGIVGIKIRRDNHYPIRPRSFGISQILETWNYGACYAGLGCYTGDFLCLGLSWWCIDREYIVDVSSIPECAYRWWSRGYWWL